VISPALALLLPLLAALAGSDSDRRVVLEDLDGTTLERDLDTFAVEGPRELEAVLVRFEGPRGSGDAGTPGTGERPAGERAELTLASGDRLVVGRLAGSGEELRFELAGGVPLVLAIEELASVVVPSRLPQTPGAPLGPAPEGDRLYHRTGDVLDRIDGAVEGFTLEGVRFDSVVGTRLYDWDEVAALYIEHEPPAATAASDDALPVVVDLLDGSRLRGSFRALDATGCTLDLGGGREVLIPARALAEIAVDDGRLAFLSDLAPAAVDEGSPFDDELGLVWRHRVDRAVDGSPLRAGGRAFTRGIGVHAPSRLTWELAGAWKELRGLVAIDDQVARLTARGSVVFRVLVDGEPRWESAVLRGGDAPQTIPPIDLTDALTLDLEVDMATEFHMGDRADWLRVILVR